tara:strand:+ start:1752 stop:2294 length:543 start_codon:yes stop_codon:yes gene_type:complete
MAFIVWKATDLEGAGAIGAYPSREACPVEDGDDDLVIEYAYDVSTEDLRSLRLSADKTTITNKHPGKTKDEQIALNINEQKSEILAGKKERLKNRISVWTKEILEEWDWKTEKAQEQDFLAGNNNKMVALATERKKIRDDGNTLRAQVDALADDAAVDAFDFRYITKDEVGLGPDRHMDM